VAAGRMRGRATRQTDTSSIGFTPAL